MRIFPLRSRLEKRPKSLPHCSTDFSLTTLATKGDEGIRSHLAPKQVRWRKYKLSGAFTTYQAAKQLLWLEKQAIWRKNKLCGAKTSRLPAITSCSVELQAVRQDYKLCGGITRPRIRIIISVQGCL